MHMLKFDVFLVDDIEMRLSEFKPSFSKIMNMAREYIITLSQIFY